MVLDWHVALASNSLGGMPDTQCGDHPQTTSEQETPSKAEAQDTNYIAL